MSDKPHRLLFRDFAASGKASDYGNTSAMEGITLQSDSAEESRPVATHVTVPIKRALLTGCFQLLEHRFQRRMKCSGVTCASLDREGDLVGVEVYVLQWQTCLLDATALMNRDLEGDPHPIRLSEFPQLPPNQIDLFLRKLRLLARLIRSEPQAGGDILICPTTAQRLIKNRAQNLQIVKGSVSRGRSVTPPFVGS